MKFTENEMVFLNSITEGKYIFGLNIEFSYKNNRAAEIENTIQGLIKKGILESETKLSSVGFLPAKALEMYKESKIYIRINDLKAAIINDSEMIAISPAENNQFELQRVPKAVILYLILEKFSVLRNKLKSVDSKPEKIEEDDILKEIKKSEGHILIEKFEETSYKTGCVYYWNKENMVKYDFLTKIKEYTEAVSVRNEIAEILEVTKGEENNGYK